MNGAVLTPGSFPALPAILRWCRTQIEAQPMERIAMGSLLGLLIVGGALLRVQGVGFPAYFTFDEELFVRNAHNYLLGLPDANDHPPLGKLVMAVGMALFGYNSLGWRFASVCFGLQSVLMAYWLAAQLFDRRAGWLAAAFVAADGFFISYSRAGLLDGMLSCLVLWGVLAAVASRSWLGTLASAMLIGTAASIKWSGGLAVVPAAAAVLVLGRAPKASILCFGLAPVIHAALWTGGLAMTGQPSDPASLWQVWVRTFEHHVALGNHVSLLASPWYTWLYLEHPIVTKLAQHGSKQCYSSSAGNVILWFSATAVVLTLPLAAALGAWPGRLRRLWSQVLCTKQRRGALLLVLGWAALLAPWVVGRGKYTFSYHYLPSYGFALVLLAALVSAVWHRWPKAALLFVGLVAAVSVYFAPVWGELPLTEAEAHRRLLFSGWQP